MTVPRTSRSGRGRYETLAGAGGAVESRTASINKGVDPRAGACHEWHFDAAALVRPQPSALLLMLRSGGLFYSPDATTAPVAPAGALFMSGGPLHSLSAPGLTGAILGAPLWLAALCAAVLFAAFVLVACLAWLVLRRTEGTELPQVLLALSHVISALCGLLPWGHPVPPPALPGPSAPQEDADAATTVVVLPQQPVDHLPERGGTR